MRLLLDTHVLIWWFGEPARLPESVLSAIGDCNNEVFVSSACVWEMAIKVSIGRLRLQRPLTDLVEELRRETWLHELPIHHEHAARVETLPHHHRDPFDRIMIAQAIVEQLKFVTADNVVLMYDADLWDARRGRTNRDR